MKRCGTPNIIVTDKLKSYGATMEVIGNANRQQTGRCCTSNLHFGSRQQQYANINKRVVSAVCF
jgi:putative transposase